MGRPRCFAGKRLKSSVVCLEKDSWRDGYGIYSPFELHSHVYFSPLFAVSLEAYLCFFDSSKSPSSMHACIIIIFPNRLDSREGSCFNKYHSN
jgi:hypothetical protein